MMEEEDCLDLPPTPEKMTDVDISLAGEESNGPTLLVAASVSQIFDSCKSVEEDQANLTTNDNDSEAEKTKDDTDEMVDSKNNPDKNESDSSDVVGSAKSVPQGGDNNRAKQLFGDANDGDSFGNINPKANDLPTAATLFGSASEANSDFFIRKESADSFSKQMNTTKNGEYQEGHAKNGANSKNSLGDSFQNLGIGDNRNGNLCQSSFMTSTSGSSPLQSRRDVQPFSPFNQQDSFLGSSQASLQGDQSQFQTPYPQPSTTANSALPSIPMGSFPQEPGRAQVYPVSQNQVPMLYNPQIQQNSMQGIRNAQEPVAFSAMSSPQKPYPAYPQALNSYPSVVNGSPDTPNTLNSANVGNSYMYTSPIASVIPGYDVSQGNQMAQKPTGTRLHQSHVPKQPVRPTGELFVPDLYGNSSTQPSNQVNIFTPEAKMNFESQGMQQRDLGASNVGQSNYIAPDQSQNEHFPPYNLPNMELYAAQSNFYPRDSQDPGFWDWVKNQDWSEGAQKIGKQILQKTKYTLEWVGSTVIDHATKAHLSKNATDTVLTTLDPGMEEYLNPLVHLAIASQDGNVLQGIRQGFKHVFGHTAAKGHEAHHSLPKLPIGFDLGNKAVIQQLDSISTVDFKFTQPYISVALQPFLTELQQGSWSCMFCIAMRDSSRGIQLLTYSQPISIPSPCISIAFSKTSQDVINYGLDLTIDDAVRFYKPYAGDHDWCSILTGIKLETIISLAAQGLASDYKREIETPALPSNDSFVVLPS